MNIMTDKVKVAFICVHNSCRSQIAEALGKYYGHELMECYSAGTETKPQINQDAVRLMKAVYGIDMEKDHFYDSGSVTISGSRIGCWKAGGHGDQTFLQVLENSCNPVERREISKMMKRLNFKYH